MLLQASYDVKKIAESEVKETPNISNIRRERFY